MQDQTAIRPATGDDLNFIYDSWLSSCRYDSPLGNCKNSIFFDNYRRIIDDVLSLDNTHVFVACLTEDPHVILGYLACELPNIIHYIFTKDAFRQFGIAKALVTHAFKDTSNLITTHRTGYVEPILRSHPQITYNPFLFFFSEGDL